MKRLLFAVGLASTLPALAADVGVSVSIGDPRFYGRIDIGNFPQPVVVYPQPVVIQPVPVERPPIYLRVPPGHAKHWAKHCHRYNACGERVFFVQDRWYTQEYAPRYREEHRDRRDDRRDERRDDRHDHRHDQRFDERRGER